MASLEFNKIAGAVLGTSLFAMGVGVIAEGIFAPVKPVKAGYELAAAEEKAPGKSDAAAAPAAPLPMLLAKADAAKGQAAAAACAACHSFEKTAKIGAKPGPPLYGVVERAVASLDGFGYSDALKAKGGKWTVEALNTWITDTQAYAKGAKMAYKEADAGKRANLIVYLNSLSESPAPLPK